MKILLLNDRRGVSEEKLIYDALLDLLKSAGHDVENFTLSNTEIMPCVGCFDCWLKTPGQCTITTDAANVIAAKAVGADAIVILSEIVFGGYSADVKSLLDRKVQNILPFFEIYRGEMHHEQRYDRSPAWISIGYGDASDAEKQTFVRLMDRNALNFRPRGHLALTVLDEHELADEGKSILAALEGTA